MGESGNAAQGIELEEKVAFLRDPAHYPENGGRVEAIETHMSWVFLTERHAYKLKKPVRYPFLDFATLKARRLDCGREIALNRRLAPDIYLDIIPLTLDHGQLSLGAAAEPVEWLVRMRRLPRSTLLDTQIAAGRVDRPALAGAVERLARFYRFAPATAFGRGEYGRRLRREIEANHHELARAEFALPPDLVAESRTLQYELLQREASTLERRAAAGRVVDAHGDLRPEHVALTDPPRFIDCLEFNRGFRLLDPADELAYLALECARLDAPELGPFILEQYRRHSDDRPPRELLRLYTALRAAMRAKIALWHTRDGAVPDHDRWRARALHYLELAIAEPAAAE